MASEILYSPQAPVRWAHLITARPQLDEAKPRAWSVELVLTNADPAHAKFLVRLKQALVDTHGTVRRRSDKGLPWKPDKENPRSHTVVKMKATEFLRDDGSRAAGPKVIDSKKALWDGSAIGNGSQMIFAFTCYGWERPEGVGLSLQIKACQVVEFVPLQVADGIDGFAEQDGYSVASATPATDEFDEFSEAPF